MDRNKNTVDDYNNLKDGENMFDDNNFPTDDAMYWKDVGEQAGYMSEMDGQITWKRVSDQDFPAQSFWGPSGDITAISPQDINQGYIGNCWIMAAVSAIAETPGRVDDFFVTKDFNDNGIYAVQMYTLGVPFTQIVDDWMPMAYDNTIFAGVGKDGSAWGAITEKAFAKRYGNYEHTVGGWMYAAVSAMNGSPYKIHSHAGATEDEIWNIIKSHDQDKDIMTAATHFCGGHDESNQDGTACSHAYTVISCMELEVDADTTVKLVKVRNPWGQEQYSGKWSDDSSLWTPELRKKVHDQLGDALEPSNEGIFFMDIGSYISNFQLSVINQDTSNWDLDYFLMLDDQTSDFVSDQYCDGCTKHSIMITNDGDAQDIYVGAHVWQDRTYGWYNWDCGQAMWSGKKHRIIDASTMDTEAYTFDADEGAVWTDAMRFDAGETKEFYVVLDWTRDNVVKDWSLTAWGTSGDVSVAYKDNARTTDKMPEYTDDKSGLDPPQPNPDEGDGDEEDDGNDGGDGDGGNDGTCADLDNGIVDPWGDACVAYWDFPDWCELVFQDSEFVPKEMCCACGGGEPIDEGDEGGDDEEENDEEENDEEENDEEENDEEENDEEEGDKDEQDDDQCIDLGDGMLDPYGDSCAEYWDFLDWCELEYPDSDFKPKELCCACGGGEKNDENDDDGNEEEENDEEENDEEENDEEENDEGDGDENEEEDDDTTPNPAEFMAQYDSNGDGILSLEEFEVFYADHCTQCPFPNAAAMFNFFDSNKDSEMILQEFEGAYKCCIDVILPTPEEIFDNYDADTDNMLNLGEFTEFYINYCKQLSFPTVQAMFSYYDMDNDGFLSETEFNAAYASCNEGTMPLVIDLIFRYDTDMDGSLSLEEFEVFHALFCQDCPFDTAEEMFNYYDANGDGKLSASEFEGVYSCCIDGNIPDDDEGDDEGDDENEEEDEDITPPMPPTDGEFDMWVAEQEIPTTEYYCYLEVHNEWVNGYNFFAGHDCAIYDLELTVMARKTDWDNHLENINSDAEELGCQDIGVFDRACRFMLKPGNNKLGIRFDAEADVDLYYETEWTNCVDNTPVE